MKMLLALEPRILFDGAALATGAEVAQDQTVQDQSHPQADTQTEASPEQLFNTDDSHTAWSTITAPSDRREIIFIDTSVSDYQTFLSNLDPGIEAVLLDPNRDGLEQMAEILGERSDIDAIHIISHGNQAELWLGTGHLTLDAMQAEYSDELAIIGQALTDHGDILIYGCNFGQGEPGREAASRLAQLIGADVAASLDDTGSAGYGGDWDLEYRIGNSETQVALNAAMQQDWVGKLAVITVDTFADVVNGSDGVTSLREAILQLNAGSGGDTIVLGSGTYILSLGSAGDDNGISGDLDIRQSVTITGAGAQTTIIDGNGLDRVFHIQNNSTVVTMSGVTIQGGLANDNGAGVFVDNSSTLNLSDAIVTNNDGMGGRGGGFHVHGTLNLNRVLISNNMADEGAGIYFHNADGGTLTNVTISGNTAFNEGGGVWTENPITIINSTIAFNTAPNGGGVVDKDGMEITITNSILHNPGSPNSDGTLISGGNNIDSDGTANLGDPLDGVDPMLGALSNNGGPTQTHALQTGSPGINAGTVTGAPAVDQRSITRDAVPDIGAFEYKPSSVTPNGEFTVNDPSGNNEQTSGPVRGAERAVDIAPNGDYVVVWTDETSSDKVLAKVMDSSGNEKVAQFQVNTVGGNNEWADVAMDDNGNFLVTWTQGNDIFIRRFLANGTAVDAGDVRVNTVTTNQQINSSVNMNGAGDFVIAWEGTGGGNEGIFIRQGSFSGGLIGNDIAVNTATAAQDPSVGIVDSGDFVVVWDTGADVFFRLYNSGGVLQNSGQVDGLLQLSAGGAAVDMSGDGRFTVAYSASLLGMDIYVRQFDAAGNPVFQPKVVNTSSLSTQANPSITMDDIGEFILVWEGAGDQTGNVDSAGVFGQKFNSSGQKIGFEFLINQTIANVQDRPSVAMLDRDNFVAVWTGSDGAQTDVFARQYGATTSAVLDLDVNDSSGASGNDYALSFTEGDGPRAIADSDTNLSDVDSTTFAYVTLSVSGLLDGNAEVLLIDGDTFALATDIPGQDTNGGSYHVSLSTVGSTAVMTIIKQSGGTFSKIETEMLIKAIQYQHTDMGAPTDGNRLIEVRVNDGTTDSAAARTTININSVNDTPAFNGLDNTPTFTEGGAAVVLDSNASITDLELDAANNYNGSTLTLVRNGGANADDFFNGSGTLFPLVESGSLVVGGTTIGTITNNSGGTLVLTFNSNATTPLVNSTLQQITYGNSSGNPPTSVQIDFTFSDGNAGNQGASGALNDTGSITVSINAINNPPIAIPDSFVVNEGSSNSLNLSTNDTDVDDGLDLTSIRIISGPTHGTIDRINTDGTVDYTHDGSEIVTDGFTYTIDDLSGAPSNTVTASLIVIPANDAPVIISDGGGSSATVSVTEGNTSVTQVKVSDAEGDTLIYSIIGGADAALFNIDSVTGVLTFITAPDFQAPTDMGSDNVYDVIVKVSDGTAADTQTIAVSVTNLPPVLINPPTPVPSPTSDPSPADRDTGTETPMEEVPAVVIPFGDSPAGPVTGISHGSTDNAAADSNVMIGQNSDKREDTDTQPQTERTGLMDVLTDVFDRLRQPFEQTVFTHEIRSLLARSEFLHDLDRVRDAINETMTTEKTYVASGVAAASGLSIGYVIWLLRSGVLLTALLSSVPAWQFVNPLLVLNSPVKNKGKNGQPDVGDDSLESMFENPSKSADTTETKGGMMPKAWKFIRSWRR